MKNSTISFIGCGNMARSLIGGLIANGMNPGQLSASDPDETQRQTLFEQFGIDTSADNNEIIAKADIVVLAIKPQIMQAVIKDISTTIKGTTKLLISIAAGIRIDSIIKWLDQPAAIIRAMPNTPALIQAGAAALLANEHANDAHKNIAEAMMRSVGATIWLDNEGQMDSVTALSGSGPAYFFYIMECMEKTAEQMGLDKDQAKLLTLETAVGAAKLALLSSNSDLAVLRQRVTSPGGTTEQALNVFMQGGLEQLINAAMNAAKQRSHELSEEFGE